MIIGNGLIANIFSDVKIDNIIFASGVSDSNETNYLNFKREEELLIYYLNNFKDKTLVYFNSILSLNNTPYLNHKNNMVNLIKKYNNYKIYNVPQLFGNNGNKNNLVNYFIESLKNNKTIYIQKDIYRSIIDIEDLRNIVLMTLDTKYNEFNISYIELLKVSEILKITADIYNIKPIIIEVDGGFSINKENDNIINDIIFELNINKNNYTKTIIEKYIK